MKRKDDDMKSLFTAFVILFVLHASSMASELGRVSFRGQQIILEADGTWRYLENQSAVFEKDADPCAGAVVISSQNIPLSYCLNEKYWKLDEPSGDYESQYEHKYYSVYLGVITDPVKMSIKFMEKNIIGNARTSVRKSGGLKDVRINEQGAFEAISGDWRVIDFSFTIQGTDALMRNYYAVGEGGAVQFIFWGPEASAVVLRKIADHVAKSLAFD